MLRYPPTDYSAATGFGGNKLDRTSERREDADFIAAQRADAAGRILLFSGDRLVSDQDRGRVLFSRGEADAMGADWDNAIYLGVDGIGPVFAGPVPLDDDGLWPTHNLRQLAIDNWLAPDVLGAVAQGRSLLAWHERHGFCANCGAATNVAQAGMRRDCPACGATHFPRTDPVVIMVAVDRQRERCLLGRQFRFPPGVYSALAGFMEPGETIEAAVRREIWEEAGIVTSRVAYHASQPWPFPSSLMLGCFAEATSFEIEPRDLELEDVRWFDRADLRPMLERTHPTFAAPPTIAIATLLLSAFAEHGLPELD